MDSNGCHLDEKAEIHPTAQIGKGVAIWQFATVMGGVVLGDNCSVGSCAEIGRNSIIGAGTRIGRGASTCTNFVCGEYVFIGPNVCFTDDLNPVVNHLDYKAEPPHVEAYASIGAGAIIMPGVRIGRGSKVGAGAIVHRDVGEDEVVASLPARKVTMGI
jgi:acetyltransferase-like isoleucine patch superfamily enzyme